MLVCVSCNIEYKEDKKFCSYCGGPLAAKEDVTPVHKNVEQKVEEESGQKLVCPNCNIIYEFGSSCIQCGSALVRGSPSKEKEELETDHEKSGDKRENLQPQKPQERQIEKSGQNLICPACKITYEDGNYCVKCGLILVPQTSAQTEEEPNSPFRFEMEEKPIPLQTFQEQLDEASHKRLICPHCKIIYEHGSSCVRCGTTLATQISFQDEKKHELPEVTEVKKEELDVPPTPEQEVKEGPSQTQIPEEEPAQKKGEEFGRRISLPRKRKRDYRRLFREAGSITIMVVAGGYFLWAIYSHLIIRSPEPKRATSKEVISQALPGSSTSTTPGLPVVETKGNSSLSKEIPAVAPPPAPPSSPPSDDAVAETLEIGKIKDLLENIRQANLHKNIDLFISCYATEFKDREGKKKATLAYWRKFDYLDLSYDLKNPSISGDTARVRVEWLIKISSKTAGQPQESRTILDVTLRKEEGSWKIKEVKQVG